MKLTEKQLQIVGHSLGINVYHSKQSKFKKDKKLPKIFYRNRFCAGSTHSDYPILLGLETLNLMQKGHEINTHEYLWFVTKLGIEKFRIDFNEYLTFNQ